jgi:alkanesulfonate monooxygenase SsuD/methylene tetrahydromethanopterin reductase-like flavin-dependent oxidoreductase (luciferase family)
MPSGGLRYGLCVANVGSYADPRAVARLAVAAEAAGWDALLVWDHLGFVWGPPAGDPWVILAAAASGTSRIRLGTAVTPVARRRPQVLAQTVATLDVLSDGRMIFGAGLGGVPDEFTRFGEDAAVPVRAARLDEGLEVLAGLWSGDRVHHAGVHYTVRDVALSPRPVQKRVPIWIGGGSGRALARAARWDGWVADAADEQRMTLTTDELAAKAAEIAGARTRGEAFDVAVIGVSSPDDPELSQRYAAAGATWWLENIHDRRASPGDLFGLVEAGPPQR